MLIWFGLATPTAHGGITENAHARRQVTELNQRSYSEIAEKE
jgi:hypothetical protein